MKEDCPLILVGRGWDDAYYVLSWKLLVYLADYLFTIFELLDAQEHYQQWIFAKDDG